MSADKQELSPEERLLQVIQTGKPVPAAAAPAQAAPPAPAVAPAVQSPVAPPPPVVVPAAPPPPAPPPPAPKPAASQPLQPAAKPVVPPAAESERTIKVAASSPKPAASPTQTASAKAAPPAASAPVAAVSTPAPAEPVAAAGDSVAAEPPADDRTAPVQMTGGYRFSLSLVNRYLLLIVLVALGIVIYDLFFTRPEGSVAGPAVAIGAVRTGDKAWSATPLSPLTTYLDQAGKRSIWVALDSGKGKGPEEKGRPPAAPASNFKLMALSPDRVSPSESMAIISDQAANKTYFVKSGQPLGETGFTLESMFDDRVILKSRKGELELR